MGHPFLQNLFHNYLVNNCVFLRFESVRKTGRVALPEVDFRIVCSKGTYIRSIARDFGQRLESGAHLTALRRTRIGEFVVEKAIKVFCKLGTAHLTFAMGHPNFFL